MQLVEEYKKNKLKISSFDDLSSTDFEDMIVENYETRTRGFVKIQDGCNNYCSYCIIPYLRGSLKSKDINIAYKEIENLVNNGFKEIVLTGIHTGSYGIGTNDNLVTLIRKISKIEVLKRIRISSIEITEINDELLKELENNDKICDHLHIPLQSGVDTVLKAMNRKYNMNEYCDIIKKIRRVRPLINITTDVIVGFPTETEEDFNETLNNIEKIAFSKIHVFPYSKRDGTAAAKLKSVVTDNEKKSRSKTLIKLSDELEENYNKKFIGKKLTVLIEEVKDGVSIGHTSNYIKVIINEKLNPNEVVKVLINKIDNNKAFGELI